MRESRDREEASVLDVGGEGEGGREGGLSSKLSELFSEGGLHRFGREEKTQGFEDRDLRNWYQ